MINHGSSRVALTAALIMAVSALSGGQSAYAASGPTGIPNKRTQGVTLDEPAIQRAIALRAKFGFRADEAYIRSVWNSADIAKDDLLGTPLTTAESANMTARTQMGPVISAIESLALSDPDFAGVWLDNEAGGVVTVAFAQDPSASLLAQVEALAGSNRVSIVHAKYSVAQLNEVFKTLEGNFIGGNYDELGVTGLAMHIMSNRVWIGLSADSSPDLRDVLAARYPSDLLQIDTSSVELDTRDVRSGPLYGGNLTTYISGGFQYSCSFGYGNMRSPGGGAYVATAGHCGRPGQKYLEGGQSQNPPNNIIGTGQAKNGVYTVGNGGTTQCDCQVIGIIQAPGSPTTRVRTAGTSTFAYTNTPPNTAVGYYNGRPVCTSGATYGEAYDDIMCGQILDVNAEAFYGPDDNNVHLVKAIETDVTVASGGDSGGAVGSSTSFMGIHNGHYTSNNHQFFSRSTYLTNVTTGADPAY